MISRVHSFLLHLHGHWEVRDNRSVNGIFVNDRKVQEAVLKDSDVVVFGGGGDHPIGAIIEQPDSEFRYEFRINPSWNSRPSKEIPMPDEDDSEEDTLDGGSDSRNPNDNNLMFEMDPTVPATASCVTLDTSISMATASSVAAANNSSPSHLSSRNSAASPSKSSSSEVVHPSNAMETDAEGDKDSKSNPKKSKAHRLAGPHDAPSSPSSSAKTHPSSSSSAPAVNEWPSGPESKKVYLGPPPFVESPTRPILSTTTLLSDIDENTRSSAAEGGVGTSDELRQSESSSLAANQADGASSASTAQEHEIDEESKARIAHLQAELHQACEERRHLTPIYRTPEDSDLMCKLCQNLIFNPTTMGCGHTFCDSCVEFLVIENPKCPECGAFVAPPIISSGTLKQEVIAVVREWTPTDKAAWVGYMTRRNEAIRYAGLELLLESFRARGVRFVNIDERWTDADRYAFAEGIDVYSSNSRMAFCRAVGLTAEWVQSANFDTLLLALGNLGLNLTVPIIRARSRAALLPYDTLQDEEDEDTQQRYWSDSSDSSSDSSSEDQAAQMLAIQNDVAFHREGETAMIVDDEDKDVNRSVTSLSARRLIVVDETDTIQSNSDEEDEEEATPSRHKKKRAPRRLSVVEPDLAIPASLLPTVNLGELDTPIGSARRPEKIPEEEEASATMDEDGKHKARVSEAGLHRSNESTMDVDGDGQQTAIDENGVSSSSTVVHSSDTPASSASQGLITFNDLIVEAMREEILQYIIQNRRQFMYYQMVQRQRLYQGQPGHHANPYHRHHHHHHQHQAGVPGAALYGAHPPVAAAAAAAAAAAPVRDLAGAAAAVEAAVRAAREDVQGGGNQPVPLNAQATNTAIRHYHLGARLGRQGLPVGGSPLQPLHQLLTELQGAQRVQPPAAPSTPIPPIVVRAPPHPGLAPFGDRPVAAGGAVPAPAPAPIQRRPRAAPANLQAPQAPQPPQQDQGHLFLQPDQAPPAQPGALAQAQMLQRRPLAGAAPVPQAAPAPNEGDQEARAPRPAKATRAARPAPKREDGQ